MRVTTFLSIDMATGKVIHHEWYDYVGPVELAKKGRDTEAKAAAGEGKVADASLDLAKSNQTVQTGARGTSDPFAKSLIPGQGGALSPYAASQFGEEKRQIAKNYGDVAQTGLRMMGNRGLAAPGAASSVINTSGRMADDATTSAYNTAKQSSLGQGLAGINYFQGQQQIYDPNKPMQTAAGAYTGLGGIGMNQNQMGSTLGDIGKGIGTAASIASMA